jgi:HK97 family phage prohead protease
MKMIERRSGIIAPLENVEVRDSGAGDGSYTIRGHAAVFNRLSLDLGGFREKIDPGAFKNVLDRNPSVLADWDHDTRWILGNTANGTLELRETPQGLHYWCRVAPTSYAADLRVLMERGDITGASFMFTIERERWEIVENADGTETVTATIEEIGELYDVTVAGRGAYPQADSSLAMLRASRFEDAKTSGRIPGWAEGRDGAPATGSEGDAPSEVVTNPTDAIAHASRVEQAKRRRAGARTP